MARSVRFPLRVGPTGGVAMTPQQDSEKSLHQCIAISLVPGDTAHAWDRRDGIPAPGGVYRTDAGSVATFVERRFALLEGRATLDSAPAIDPPNESGIRRVSIFFTNLESGTPQAATGAL